MICCEEPNVEPRILRIGDLEPGECFITDTGDICMKIFIDPTRLIKTEYMDNASHSQYVTLDSGFTDWMDNMRIVTPIEGSYNYKIKVNN